MTTTQGKPITPLDLAITKRHSEIADYLRGHGAKQAFELPKDKLNASVNTIKLNIRNTGDNINIYIYIYTIHVINVYSRTPID